MKLHELICAVSVMRTAQKTYFQTRTKEDFYNAKNMERIVDALLEQAFAQPSATSPGSAMDTTPSSAELNSQTEEPTQQTATEQNPPF